MRVESRFLAVAVIGLIAGTGCSSTPIDPRCADLTTLSIACAPNADVLACRATVHFYCGDEREVTPQAEWRSSDPGVVAVSAGGVARSVGLGDAEIRATYQGVGTIARVRVLAGQPPLPLFEIGSFVRSLPGCGANDGVSGVLVTVTAGLNAGRSATTGNSGLFTIPDVVYGPIGLRAQKDGYEDAVVDGAVGVSPGVSPICIRALR